MIWLSLPATIRPFRNRHAALRCAPRLPEKADSHASNDPVWSRTALGLAISASLFLQGCALPGGAPKGPEAPVEERLGALPPAEPFTVRTAEALAKKFDSTGYRLAALRKGNQAPPRLYLQRFPADWADATSGKKRKDLFFRSILPMVSEANRLILLDRRRLKAMVAGRRPAEKAAQDRAWLKALAKRYGVRDRDPKALLTRVDMVPASLALAQAALESGWGTSRFAAEANALFGQWTWKAGQGLAPKQREAGKTHAVRRFDSLLDSVIAYMDNLNTTRAYAPFRQKRAAARQRGERLSGDDLAAGLIRYSEEREAYVDKVRLVIRHNNLGPFDRTPLVPRQRIAMR